MSERETDGGAEGRVNELASIRTAIGPDLVEAKSENTPNLPE